LLHRVGVFAVGEGAYLNVEQFVLRLLADEDVIAVGFEGGL